MLFSPSGHCSLRLQLPDPSQGAQTFAVQGFSRVVAAVPSAGSGAGIGGGELCGQPDHHRAFGGGDGGRRAGAGP